MFTGIVQGKASVESIAEAKGVRRLTLRFPEGATKNLVRGASVAIEGVCLTAIEINDDVVGFDVIDETVKLTTLGERVISDPVNFERAVSFGQEIGGHVVSGHISCRGDIVTIERDEANVAMEIQVPVKKIGYILPKGFVSIDGISLTVGVVDNETGRFWLHLIPETLQVTTLGQKSVTDTVNIELDSTTQAIVDTVLRVLKTQSLIKL